MSSLSVKTNRLFSPATPPPLNPPKKKKHPRLMDCDVYRPHAELGKYPPQYRFKKGKNRGRDNVFFPESVSLIHIF